MTRFARAEGSKASNARVPEEATSWAVMKQQLKESKLKKQYDNELSKTHNIYSSDISESFSKPNTVSRDKVWEEFDVEDNVKSVRSNDKNLLDKRNSKNNDTKKNEKLKNKPAGCRKMVASTTSDINKKICNFSGNTFVIAESKSYETSTKKKTDRGSEDTLNVFGSIHNTSSLEPRDESKVCQKRKKTDTSVKDYSHEMKSSSATEESRLELVKKFDKLKPDVNNKKIKFNSDYYGSHKNKYFDEDTTSEINSGASGVNVSYFQGCAVKKEDADRLYQLKNNLRVNGVPKQQALATLQAERRNAEKALARSKKSVCLRCRKFGHNVSDCPEFGDQSGICFKCGSTEHSAKMCRVQSDSFKFAHCFICQEQGHISRQCPDNPKGLYPKGGACKTCGDVTHLKSDCPMLITKKEKFKITLGTVHGEAVEGLDEDFVKVRRGNHNNKRIAVVKF